MKIAYFTPYPPERSGIADFIAELLPELTKRVEVDLFVSEALFETIKDSQGSWKVYRIKDYRASSVLRNQYQLSVFQMGNHFDFHQEIATAFMQFGGILELHDVVLRDFFNGATVCKPDYHNYLDSYVEVMEYCHGLKTREEAVESIRGLREPIWAASDAMKYPLVRHFLEKATAVIVHSEFARQYALSICPESSITTIPLLANEILTDPTQQKIKDRKLLHIDPDHFVIGSFGLATPGKLNDVVLRALALIKPLIGERLHFFIVGEVIDKSIYEEISFWGLERMVTITGYVNHEEFLRYISLSDLCINLRYPTQGESSGVIPRFLGYGKPVITTDIGSFSEYPNSCVLKIKHDKREVLHVAHHIYSLFLDSAKIENMSLAALEYANKYLDKGVISLKYIHFFKQVKSASLVNRKSYDLLLEYIEDDSGIEKFAPDKLAQTSAILEERALYSAELERILLDELMALGTMDDDYLRFILSKIALPINHDK